MIQRISKWGNSLAYRIPKPYAEELGWAENEAVNGRIVDGRLVIEGITGPKYTLDELLAGITPENLHQEISTGHVVGNEVW